MEPTTEPTGARTGRRELDPARERRRRLTRRGLPFLGGCLALLGFVPGLLLGAARPSEAERVAEDFTRAWEREDYAGMYRLLSSDARRSTPSASFERAYKEAMSTATATGIEAGEAHEEGDEVVVPVTARTRVFGAVGGELRVPIDGGSGASEEGRVDWTQSLVFPGLAASETLRRESEPPTRADILARDGSAIATGPATARRSSSDTGAPSAGTLGRARAPAEREELYARGFARDTRVGLTGLELVLQPMLAGAPGGRLLAGSRTLASAAPRPAPPVRTTIDAGLQAAAVSGLAGQAGGVVALDAGTAEVRAFAGAAASDPRAPGSTFKIVTTTAALEGGFVKLSTRFPFRTLERVEEADLDNVRSDACGGTFAQGFAESCNPVFAAVGLQVGADRLLGAAERFGFNSQPSIPDARASTVPQPAELAAPSPGALPGKSAKAALAETAIGQGDVRATPLQLATLAQTVAAEGARTEPSLLPGAAGAKTTRVTSRSVARTLEELMISVVENGTGQRAAIGPREVAGKTGTGQLEGKSEKSLLAESDTDAWFTGYAPADDPELVAAVLLQRSGSGGKSAAPVARSLLVADLSAEE